MKLILLFFCFLPPLLSQPRLIPHVTLYNGDFQTWIIVENPTENIEGFQIDTYSVEGILLPFVLDQVRPHETKIWTSNQLLGLEHSSHFVIGGNVVPTSNVKVTVAYGRADGTGSPVYVQESSVSAPKWRFYAGEWSKVYDAVAIVNTSDADVQITLRHLGLDGSILQERILAENAVPLSKTLYVISSAEPAFDRSLSPIFEVVSSGPVQVLALQGDSDSIHIWQNTASPRE